MPYMYIVHSWVRNVHGDKIIHLHVVYTKAVINTTRTMHCIVFCPCCRRRKLDEIKQRKLSELRAAGIPEKYCAEVSRRITAPPPSFTMSQLN